MNDRVMECAKASKAFGEEIEHFLLVGDREYHYDPVFALFDAMNLEDQKRAVVDTCRTLLIEFGFFRVMPQDEIDATTVSPGISKWVFKRGGVAYTTDEHEDDWTDAVEPGWAKRRPEYARFEDEDVEARIRGWALPLLNRPMPE